MTNSTAINKRIENEVSTTRNVSQWKTNRGRVQISQENFHQTRYYKDEGMSNN